MKHRNFYKRQVLDLEEKIKEMQEEVTKYKRIIMKKDYLIQGLERDIQLNKTKDLLTDSYTKQHLVLKYREAINMHKRWGFKISLCYFDMDAMKEVNEKYGIDYGDSILMSFSKLVKYLIRDDLDSLFRIGGDEFLVMCIDCGKEDALNICRRIQREFHSITEGQTLSFGIKEVNDPLNNSLESHLSHVKKELEMNKKIN